MNAIILSIGDELALGQTIDTNSAWISQQLAAVGCDIRAHLTVPDGQPAIEKAIRDFVKRCDFLIISGGIGPTEDDLTRQALAVVMDAPLELNEVWLNKLQDFFKARGRAMPETNKIQAMIPRGARMIENTAGTAAGIDAIVAKRESSTKFLSVEQIASILEMAEGADVASSSLVSDEYMERMFGKEEIFRRKWLQDLLVSIKKGEPIREFSRLTTRVFVMPGVPKEMKAMFTRDVLPHIAATTGGAVILSRTLHTFGLGESWVAEKLGDLMKRDRNPSVGTTVSHGIVSLRINARFGSREEAQKQLDETTRACQAALGDIIFGADDQTLGQVIADLLNRKSQIANHKSTLTTAESCTGGLLAKMLTDLSGASDYFKTGFVTYSNEAKTELLGVDAQLIAQHGAVSEPVASAMAAGALKRANADFALSITGIAGPTGGTAEKPVGTVCIALATQSSVLSPQSSNLIRTFNFPGDREMIRDRSAKMALTILRYQLMNLPLPF